MWLRVVSYRNSTSNHNTVPVNHYQNQLYLIEILHQTTTIWHQRQREAELYLIEILHQTTTFHGVLRNELSVVSYRNSTSNHNDLSYVRDFELLYLIEILHQTTTCHKAGKALTWLYLIEILHQTTTTHSMAFSFTSLYLIEILHQTTTLFSTIAMTRGCILSKFYIKPQP